MRLFLSYSRRNEGHARRLFENLQSRGVTVWFDREALLPGQDWRSAINSAISESDTVLLLLSSESVDRRGYFQKEMRAALEVLQTIPHGHIYLLPVRIDECRIPESLTAIHYVDLFPNYETGIQRIKSALDFQEDLQAKVQASDFDGSVAREPSASVLLVNDEPATMNALADHLKAFGLSVEHAFSVPQAISAVHDRRPDLIISDLSHFSFGTRITDRAAFEILEWGAENHDALKVIVTAADITTDRREEAERLGAIGICNDAATLYRYINESMSLEIPNPFSPEPETVHSEISIECEDVDDQSLVAHQLVAHQLVAHQEVRHRSVFLWNMWHDKDDAEFTRRLADELRIRGIDAVYYVHTINFGATFSHPADRLIDNSDVVVFLISAAAVKATWIDEFIYKTRLKKGAAVVPALLDDEGARSIPPMLRNVRPLDFRGDYQRGVDDLVSFIRSTKYR